MGITLSFCMGVAGCGCIG